MQDALEGVRIGVVGLGYVGLPLAAAFGGRFETMGFDIDSARVERLRSGTDETGEVDTHELAQARRLRFTSDLAALGDCNVYIVAVPTPVTRHKWPDLEPLRAATRSVARVLKRGDTVVYESTVYPGATEEVCVPRLESISELTFNRDFFVGYSPERVNPGDRTHRVTNIRKITSGSTPETAAFIDRLYGTVVEAGTYPATSIRVAEAAKVIENTQRDVNIALMNELARIFHRIGIDTLEVLAAAGSKWNFLPFRPGLVGGHCIGVDPYYLTHKALEAGYQPTVIPAARLLNDNMGEYVAERVVRLMARRAISIVNARVLLMGFAFKENCPDLRNTRCIDIVRALGEYHAEVEIYDPLVDTTLAEREYGVRPIDTPAAGGYDAIIVAVAHDRFREAGIAAVRGYGREASVIFDVKGLFPAEAVDERL